MHYFSKINKIEMRLKFREYSEMNDIALAKVIVPNSYIEK